MCHPEAKSNVLCDEKSYKLCEADYNFQDLGEAKVKGKDKPIAIFRPLKIKSAKNQNNEQEQQQVQMIGRITEKTLISKAIEAKVIGGSEKLVIIEGEGGLGLSTLKDFCTKEVLRVGAQLWFISFFLA